MPRRKSEMIESAINAASDIRKEVTKRMPDAHEDSTEAEIERVTRIYAAYVLADATDDLAEIIRLWTP